MSTFDDKKAQELLEYSKGIKRSLRGFLNVQAGRDGSYELKHLDHCVNLLSFGHTDEVADIIEGFSTDEIATLIMSLVVLARLNPFPDEKKPTQQLPPDYKQYVN